MPYRVAAVEYRVEQHAAKLRDKLAALRPAVPESAFESWRALLERCDLARFAGLAYTPPESADARRAFAAIVAESLPAGEAAAAGQGGPAG